MKGLYPTVYEKIKILQHFFDLIVRKVPKNNDSFLKNKDILVLILRKHHLIVLN